MSTYICCVVEHELEREYHMITGIRNILESKREYRMITRIRNIRELEIEYHKTAGEP